MRNVVWYSPFLDGSFKSDIELHVKKCNARAHKQKKAYYGVQATLGSSKQLTRFGKNLRLYVIGHGDFSSKYIIGETSKIADLDLSMHVKGYSNYMMKLALTPQQLCDKLMEEEPHPKAEIRIWACLGARGMNNFASEFAKLYCHWYPTAKVFGYSGYMLLAGGHKRGQIVKDEDIASSPAKKFMLDVTPKSTPVLSDDVEEEAPEELLWQNAEPQWTESGL